MELIEKIKSLIRNSDSLNWSEKLDMEILLDTSEKALEVRDHENTIRVLENLYSSVTSDVYKETLLGVLKKYRGEIRKLSSPVVIAPFTLRDFLGQLGIDTSGIDEKKLDSKLTVAMDDGMGYSPGGFEDVSDGYRDEDTGEIRIWI